MSENLITLFKSHHSANRPTVYTAPEQFIEVILFKQWIVWTICIVVPQNSVTLLDLRAMMMESRENSKHNHIYRPNKIIKKYLVQTSNERKENE